MLAHSGCEPKLSDKMQAHLVWMSDRPLRIQNEYQFKFASNSCFGSVSNLVYKVDINTLEQHAESNDTLNLNDIALASITLSEKIVIDRYQQLARTGSFIVIDRHTNATVGAGMIEQVCKEAQSNKRSYSTEERELNAYVRKHFPEWGCIEI